MTQPYSRQLFSSALFLFAFNCSAQSDYFKSWEMPVQSGIYNIQPAADGGAYLTIYAGIAALAKVDAAGDTLWVKRPIMIPHEGTNLHVADGHLFLVGSLGSEIGNMPVIYKMTMDGDTVWTAAIDGVSDMSSMASLVLADGSVVVSLTGVNDPQEPNTQRPFLSRTSASGELLWSVVPGFVNDGDLNGMAQDATGDIWAVGRSYKTATQFNEGMLMRIAPTGALVQAMNVPSPFANSSVTLLHVNPLADGRVILWGRVSNGPLGVSSWATFTIAANGTAGNWTYYGSAGGDNPTGVAYRANGTTVVSGNCGEQWVNAIIGADGSILDAVAIGEAAALNIAVAMALSGNDHVIIGGTQGSSSPNSAFARVALGSTTGCVTPFALLRENGATVTLLPFTVPMNAYGTSVQPVFFPFPADPMVVTDVCLTTAVEEAAVLDAAVWPNPTDGMVTIDLGAHSDRAMVEVLDLQGRTLIALDGLRKGLLQLNMAALDAGVYAVRITAGNAVRSVRVVRR